MSEIINGFISSATLTISVYAFGALILKNKEKKENKIIDNIIIILISIILHTFVFLYLTGTIKSILLCIIFMLTFKHLFKSSYGKSLISAIIYIFMLVIPDLLVLILATEVLNISKIMVHNNLAGTILGNLLVSGIMIIIIYILRKPLRKLINYNFSTSKKIILVSLLTLISILIFFYNLINTFRLNEDIIGYLFVIITLVVILYYLFRQKMENENILKKYDDLLNIMKNYESDIEEQRTMIHETRNELMTIKSKISDKERESSIIKYIDSILGDKISSNMSKYSKFMYLPSNGIKGFFYYKFMEAEKRGIKVSVNISKKIENSFLGNLDTKDFKDLVRIIGVYLDNAIEASEESKDKKLGIEIYLAKEDIDIIISNTFNNEIKTDKLGIERFTTKGKKHGYGLLLVKHILGNNTKFVTEQNIVDNVFTQKIKIKDNKKTQQ